MSALITLMKDSKFLSTTLWQGISHRSKKLSSLFLVMTVAMLKIADFPGVTVGFASFF
jgi:hypothetical protein